MQSGYRVGAVQASGPASEAGVATYFIRQGSFAPQGPFEEARVAGYIAQGKLRPGMEISADGQRWMPVEEHRLFAAAAPPFRAVATPPPVRAVQPVEEVEEVEEISAAPAARPERRPARRPRPAPASGGGGKAALAVVGILVVGGIAYVVSPSGTQNGAERAALTGALRSRRAIALSFRFEQQVPRSTVIEWLGPPVREEEMDWASPQGQAKKAALLAKSRATYEGTRRRTLSGLSPALRDKAERDMPSVDAMVEALASTMVGVDAYVTWNATDGEDVTLHFKKAPDGSLTFLRPTDPDLEALTGYAYAKKYLSAVR